MNKDFAIFIITNGRPKNVVTIKTLNKCGYTGKYYLVVDNEDESILSYRKNHGDDSVIIFDKKKYADSIDEGNNFDNRRTTTHARNACFDIASNLGLKYFMVLDDDYNNIRWRYSDKYITKGFIKNLDLFISYLIKFYEKTTFKTICFAQGGDFIGGDSCGLIQNYKNTCRKAMNSFLCSTDRRFNFIGQLNEDVNTYVTLGSVGDLFLTIPNIGLEQVATQKTSGGMTDAYLRYGTYCKSFTTVMMAPSSVKVSMMGFTSNRLHHRIDWNATTPKIISEKNKKY